MRIAIVNDVRMIIEVLRRVISNVPSYEVAWIAKDGAEAVKKCAEDTPDLILMDLIMPVMGGVDATNAIMKNTPCAILIVTSNVSDNMSKVFEAMGYGALDVVNAPVVNNISSPEGIDEILKKIATIGQLLGIKEKTKGKKDKGAGYGKLAGLKKKLPPLVVIGASTGGPMALAKIISRFPENTQLATVIIQHVDQQFSQGLAAWLAEQTLIPVEIARNGIMPSAGKILLAGTNNHLMMTHSLALKYTPTPLELPYRPSVDIFFNSIAQNWPDKGVAILLTGMGNDGAKGMKALHDLGWHTIAEHQKSCVVFGMPKAAIELGAASEVLPIEQIAPKVLSYVREFHDQ